MRDHREDIKALERFNKIQLGKLKHHIEKKGWSEMSLITLFHLLIDEVNELKAELLIMNSLTDIQKEAADIANFAMMISDNADRMKT